MASIALLNEHAAPPHLAPVPVLLWRKQPRLPAETHPAVIVSEECVELTVTGVVGALQQVMTEPSAFIPFRRGGGANGYIAR